MKIIQKAGCESKCVQIGFTRRAVGKQRKTWGEKKKASPRAVQGDAKCYNRPKCGWAGQIKAQHREQERKKDTKWKDKDSKKQKREIRGKTWSEKQRWDVWIEKTYGLTCWGCRRRCPPGVACWKMRWLPRCWLKSSALGRCLSPETPPCSSYTAPQTCPPLSGSTWICIKTRKNTIINALCSNIRGKRCTITARADSEQPEIF